MAETPIVSETLQSTFRSNFPSQVSSGRDLHVSDVIVPIVDFSSTAGTTGLGTNLQTALNTAGSFTSIYGGSSGGPAVTATIFSNTGFIKVTGGGNYIGYTTGSGTSLPVEIFIDDGTTEYTLFKRDTIDLSFASPDGQFNFDFICFLRAGDTLKGRCAQQGRIEAHAFQIADINGTLVNPTGYTGS